MLTPTAFEEAVADLLRDMGYKRVSRSGGAGDLAADITAKDKDGRSVIVQCKRYALEHAVGSREIQLFIGMSRTHHKADRGMFVTTSRFTKAAADLARKHKIELFNGVALAELLVQVRGKPEPGPELTLHDLVKFGAGGPIDTFRAIEILEEKSAERLAHAEAIGCQCVSENRNFAASKEAWEERGAIVLWCPDCGRPATAEEMERAKEIGMPPPD